LKGSAASPAQRMSMVSIRASTFLLPGKSTLFTAIRTCLFCRHDSKTQDIRDLASDGSQLPATVQLTFAQNGRIYVIRKSFLASASLAA
jgi:hypothetical protein